MTTYVVTFAHQERVARNVRNFTRRLRERWREHCAGEISFAEFDAGVQGWVNHVGYADTWGLRRHVLGRIQKPKRAKIARRAR